MIFLLCALVPLGASYLVHHPDERHYTDAGLEMVKTGDYVVPRNSDGTARLRKPALCYWMVSASFSAFGPSPLSARLPFILCGVAIVWLTHRLATAVTASNEAAWISTLLVLSNGLFLTSAARSIPDVVVCLFLLLSALGFVQVLVLGARKPSAYYCAYVGAGLAFASKGLLAAAFVGYVFAFQVCRRRSLKALLDLIHVKAIVCGVLIAGSWFLLAYWRLGGEVASVFWSDQVRQKMSVDLVTPLYQVPLYGVITVVSFLPWMAAGAHQLVRERRMFAFRSDREREYWLFVAPWAVVTAVIFGCSSSLYSRYCLPIIPLLAVSLGPALLRIKREILERWMLPVSRVLHVALLLLVVAACLAVQPDRAGILLTTLAAGLSAAGLLRLNLHETSPTTALVSRVAVAMVMLVPLTSCIAARFALPDQGEQIATSLRSARELRGKNVYFLGKPALASKVRLFATGAVTIQSSEWIELPPEPPSVVVASDANWDKFGLPGYQVTRISRGFRDIPIDGLIHAIWTGRTAAYLESRREYHVLAVRRSTEHAASRPANREVR